MDFSGVVDDVTNHVFEIVSDVLEMNISSDEKIQRLQSVFDEIGERFGQQMFDALSELFGSSAIQSQVPYNENNQTYALAQKIVRDWAFELDDKAIVKEYSNVLLGRAEQLAFVNAISLRRHPTVTRRLVGETCEWCAKLEGTHVDPDPIYFARHDYCDCDIKLSGFNSRNGLLKNYTKASQGATFTDQFGDKVTWDERLKRIHAGEDRNNFKLIKETA